MSERDFHSCRFCQRNAKETHYCEECGNSCCSDCLAEEKVEYYVCQDCNSTNIEEIKSENKRICKNCKKENILKATRIEKACPKCHSLNIVNIYEKKDTLEQNYLELITKSREILAPLREIQDKWNIIRQKIKNARAPPIKCYHFPHIETELLNLFQNYVRLRNDVVEKLKIHFHHLSVNEEFFFGINSQPNSNIKIIEGILENQSRSFHSIKEFINVNVKGIIENIESHEKKIQFIEKITKYFASYRRFLNLAEEEKPVYAITAKLTNGSNNQEILNKKKGILFVTNFDLSFVHEYGLIKKKRDLILKAPVNDLLRIKEKGRVFKKLYLEFAYGNYEFSLPPKSLSRVIEYILLARTFDEAVIRNHESANKLHSITININDLSNFIENAINSFFSRRCRYSEQLIEENFKSGSNIRRNPNSILNQFDKEEEKKGYTTKFRQYPKYNNLNHNDEMPNFINSRLKEDRYDNNSRYHQNNFIRNHIKRNSHYENIDEKTLLMRKLKQAQDYRYSTRDSENYPFQDRGDFSNGVSPKISRFKIKETNSFFKQNDGTKKYQDSRRNHLSDFFKQEYSTRDSGRPSDDIIDNALRESIARLDELKMKQFASKETLKELSYKFDHGKLNELDYFKTYRSLQEEVFALDNEILQIEDELEQQRYAKLKRNMQDDFKFYP